MLKFCSISFYFSENIFSLCLFLKDILARHGVIRLEVISHFCWKFECKLEFFCWLTFFVFQFSSVAQLCPTLWDPMNRSTPGLPVHHHLPEFTQTHVHRVGDAIQPSHPLSSPSPPAHNPSQHQSFPMSQLFA